MLDYTQFQKPQRYIGNEGNVVKKPKSTKIKICISYPALYEVGMSNLGIRIIYGILNGFCDVACERVFMPADDFQDFLRKNRIKLPSLETKTPLDEFQILGFNFNYELNFTNFLSILELGAIKLKAEQRKNIIVFGGGVANPEPLAEFVDVFLIGEFEEVAEKFVEVLRTTSDKDERLKAFSEIDGFYVPAFYSFSFKDKRYIFEKKYPRAKLPIKKVYLKNLDKSEVPLNWLTPHTSIIHDRAQIEIARGCPNRCNFCQAKVLYHPYRERQIATIKDIVEKIYASSGYENFSFLALSASDFSSIEELIGQTFDYFSKRRIGLSLPSLRITDLVTKLYKKLIALKKLSLTLAVEAANEPLRERLGKKIDVKELIEAAKIIYSLKMRHLKVYFMFGLPHESEDDLIAIGTFLRNLQKVSRLELNASINIFVPKPFSIWEDVAMEEESILLKKREIILRNIFGIRRSKVSLSNLYKSIVEAVIARGDRKLSSAIYRAYQKGAQFDGYRENFSWDIWRQSFEEAGIDYRFYLKAQTENFPWSFIELNQKPETKNQKS